MNLTHREQQEIIALTTTRLAPLRLYVAPTQPSNDNQNWNNHDGDTGSSNACLQLADKVGSSWRIRRALLVAVASGSYSQDG